MIFKHVFLLVCTTLPSFAAAAWPDWDSGCDLGTPGESLKEAVGSQHNPQLTSTFPIETLLPTYNGYAQRNYNLGTNAFYNSTATTVQLSELSCCDTKMSTPFISNEEVALNTDPAKPVKKWIYNGAKNSTCQTSTWYNKNLVYCNADSSALRGLGCDFVCSQSYIMKGNTLVSAFDGKTDNAGNICKCAQLTIEDPVESRETTPIDDTGKEVAANCRLGQDLSNTAVKQCKQMLVQKITCTAGSGLEGLCPKSQNTPNTYIQYIKTPVNKPKGANNKWLSEQKLVKLQGGYRSFNEKGEFTVYYNNPAWNGQDRKQCLKLGDKQDQNLGDSCKNTLVYNTKICTAKFKYQPCALCTHTGEVTPADGNSVMNAPQPRDGSVAKTLFETPAYTATKCAVAINDRNPWGEITESSWPTLTGKTYNNKFIGINYVTDTNGNTANKGSADFPNFPSIRASTTSSPSTLKFPAWTHVSCEDKQFVDNNGPFDKQTTDGSCPIMGCCHVKTEPTTRVATAGASLGGGDFSNTFVAAYERGYCSTKSTCLMFNNRANERNQECLRRCRSKPSDFGTDCNKVQKSGTDGGTIERKVCSYCDDPKCTLATGFPRTGKLANNCCNCCDKCKKATFSAQATWDGRSPAIMSSLSFTFLVIAVFLRAL